MDLSLISVCGIAAVMGIAVIVQAKNKTQLAARRIRRKRAVYGWRFPSN